MTRKHWKAEAKKARALHSAMKAAADELERAAANMRREAETRAHTADWCEAMADIPKLLAEVRARISGGLDEAAARAKVGEIYHVQPESLAAWMGQDERARRSARLWRRDREVMALAWAGKTNAEIAELLPKRGYRKLTANSVSRIISGKLRGGAVRDTPGGRLQFAPALPAHETQILLEGENL
jgi:hypothetical protein